MPARPVAVRPFWHKWVNVPSGLNGSTFSLHRNVNQRCNGVPLIFLVEIKLKNKKHHGKTGQLIPTTLAHLAHSPIYAKMGARLLDARAWAAMYLNRDCTCENEIRVTMFCIFRDEMKVSDHKMGKSVFLMNGKSFGFSIILYRKSNYPIAFVFSPRWLISFISNRRNVCRVGAKLASGHGGDLVIWPVRTYRICRNKRPGRLIFSSNKLKHSLKPIRTHRFCVLPPLRNHPSEPIGFVYSPLWEITPSKLHRFCVLPPLRNHPSEPIGFGGGLLPPLRNHPIKAHRFCVLPPLSIITCFWWASSTFRVREVFYIVRRYCGRLPGPYYSTKPLADAQKKSALVK